MKIRITKRINVGGQIQYMIQQKLFWWWFKCSLCINVPCHGSFTKSHFDTLKEAKNNLCYFDGTKRKEKVVLTSKKFKE